MRAELFHPLIAHFPIALLSLYPFILLVNIFINEKFQELSLIVSRVFLYAGLFFHLISMYLGDVALEKISSNICKLQLVYDHEHKAKLVLFSFLFILGADLFIYVKMHHHKLFKPLKVFKLLISFLGLFFVFETGHSGASLVYDYGAGVKVHASCKSPSK